MPQHHTQHASGVKDIEPAQAQAQAQTNIWEKLVEERGTGVGKCFPGFGERTLERNSCTILHGRDKHML